jgi:hypothetical protein
MRFVSLSLLATSAGLALLGCSSEHSPATAPTPADTQLTNSSARHDDAVDAPGDLSWVPTGQTSGASSVRLLMTDAPVAADNVFVTFCGIYVEPALSSTSPQEADAGSDAGVEPVEKSRLAAHGNARGTAAAQTDAGQAEPERDNDDVALPGDAGSDHAERGKAIASHAGWRTISDTCQTLDLLTLQGGITEAIGIGSLPAGDYGQIRLMLVDAAIVVSGSRFELVVPSGSESGLKIGSGFSLHEGTATTITLDFDAGQSVHYTQGRGYMMAPVIHVVDLTLHPATHEDAGGSRAE